MGETICGIILIILIPASILIGWFLDENKWKKDLKLFKPGMIIDYYTHIRHGKFRKQKHLYSVEILDVDGKYALVNQLDKDNEHEINLEFEMKYSDEMDLRTKDGTIIKKWGFDI